MQSPYRRGGPSTPSRGLQASQSGSQGATSGSTINNTAPQESRFTPRRKSTLTPSRYIPPSPLPGLHQSASQSSSSQITASQGSQAISIYPSISFQDPKYRALADNVELKIVIEQTQNNIDNAIKVIKHGKSERRRAHEALKIELLEEDRRWEGECERLRKEGADVVRALEREKGEIADATAKLTQLENRKRAFAAQLDALRGELEEWSTKIQTIKEANDRVRRAFEQEAKKDGPELAFLESKLGLTIEGKPRDVVAFRFTLLDPSDHKRVFEVHIDASDSDFSIPLCKPQLPPSALKPLVMALNEERDLNTFIKHVRRAFVVLVESEGGRDMGIRPRSS